MKKLALAVSASLAMAGSASAATVLGVSWDSSLIDWDASISQRHEMDTSPVLIGDQAYLREISGFGRIDIINGQTAATFCTGICKELTFMYGAFREITPASVGANTATDTTLLQGGWVKFFVGTDGSAAAQATGDLSTAFTAANTGDGILFLDMIGAPNAVQAGYDIANTTNGLIADKFDPIHFDAGGLLKDVLSTSKANWTFAAGKANTLTQQGTLSIIGGAAFSEFQQDTTDNSPFGKSDMNFSFTSDKGLNVPDSFDDGTGGGSFSSKVIPEPGSLALVGLGIFGLGALRRRRAGK